MEKQNNNIKLIIICVVLVIVLGLLYLYKGDKKDKTVDEKEISYNLLEDYSRFFTVNSCIYKYFSYLSSKDTDSLLKVLDKKFIDSNNINEDNIFEKTLDLNAYYSFTSKKIYYKVLTEGYIEYYVFGYAEEENLNSDRIKDDYYFIVVFDEKNSTFSITPIDSELFEEVRNG